MSKQTPKHVAIILDGNGRWATKRGLPRTMGHQKGATNLKKIVETAHHAGIKVLSVFAFSTENWSRPQAEVDFLMGLPKAREQEILDALNHPSLPVRVIFSGRRDRLNEYNFNLMIRIEEETAHHEGLTLNVCLDYGAHDELTLATQAIAKKVAEGALTLDEIEPKTIQEHLFQPTLPPVDLLIRTSGEQRISNFLLWQAAYAEFYFTKVHWPAFTPKKFEEALASYASRTRRFGKVVGEDE